MNPKDHGGGSAPEQVEAAEAPRAPGLVVGLGASAGGLAAFEHFFARMPPESGMAFVLVQHLTPDHVILLPALLAQHTRMPVRQVEADTPIAPNHVYVIPPDATLTIDRGVVHLVSPPREPRFQRMPIDCFFRSLSGSAPCVRSTPTPIISCACCRTAPWITSLTASY